MQSTPPTMSPITSPATSSDRAVASEPGVTDTCYHASALGQRIGAILRQFRDAIDGSPKLGDGDYLQELQHTLAQLVPLSAQIAYPAQGNTLQRWQVLAQVAACDLNLVKFFESHLDALAILAELGVSAPAPGLWAVWAADGGTDPLRFDGKQCHGQKLWCSGAAFVDHGLVSYRDACGVSQLLMLPMRQPQIMLDDSGWYAVGMPYTATVTLTLQGAQAMPVMPKATNPNISPYLDRAGFWHGAAGVAACWYGAATTLADSLYQSYQQKPHAFKALYLGEVAQALAVTQSYLYQVAQRIDNAPTDSHELAIRTLRAQVESTTRLVLTKTGQALGAAPYCKNLHFARLSADLAVFIRQTHGAFDSEAIGKLVADPANKQVGSPWQL